MMMMMHELYYCAEATRKEKKVKTQQRQAAACLHIVLVGHSCSAPPTVLNSGTRQLLRVVIGTGTKEKDRKRKEERDMGGLDIWITISIEK